MRPSNDYELSCHDNFEQHQTDQGRTAVTCDEAREVWDLGFYFRRNTAERTAEWLIDGRTAAGRLVTIAILWRPDWLDWHAYTAWDVS